MAALPYKVGCCRWANYCHSAVFMSSNPMHHCRLGLIRITTDLIVITTIPVCLELVFVCLSFMHCS